MADLIEIVDHNGIARKLGRTPTPAGMMRARGATNICDYRESVGLPRLIPRSEWKPISFVNNAPTWLIEDQGNEGSCSCATVTGASSRMRYLRGQAIEPLSWPWLYDQVNGGRDAGSNMGEAADVAQRIGVPPMTSYKKCQYRSGRNPQGVQYYKEFDVDVTFSNFDEYVTGLLGHGALIQHAIDAGGLNNFDNDGVCTRSGGSANHSIYSAGLNYLSGKWVLELVNSWRLDFGPFGNGTCYVTERQCNDVASTDDAVGHLVTLAPTGGQGAPNPQ